MSASSYRMDWVTDAIAVGGAPLSYEQLDQIKAQGVDAIVNLCAEYCDLHAIERDSGFEVYYLPVDDECAPDCEALERAMEWMDGILAQNRRLLIHCRLGMGRTGTLLYAYLWSRNLQERVDPNLLEALRARPSNYAQWCRVRPYQHNGSGRVSEPTTEAGASAWTRLTSRLRRLFARY